MSRQSVFIHEKYDQVPVVTAFRNISIDLLEECAVRCLQEVECVTFAVTPSPTGSVTCLMYDEIPLANSYRPEVDAITMELVKIAST